ncbi:MAG: hypothetical protein ACE37B_05340 [Ilumatobacter sp.]|uniref:hypothetical protein n=1 Tax=Ilumatobacter sp. TaxID=1967498 RepID=UPI00391A7036
MIVRDRALAVLNTVGALRTLTLWAAATVAIRRGADESMIGHIRNSGLDLTRALQAISWASAAAGAGAPPRHFQPGDHFVDRDARARAASLARAAEDPRVRSALIGLDDDLELSALGELIQTDLVKMLADAATSPSQRTAVAPGSQRHIAKAVTGVLEPTGIQPFLMSGSLLGVIRDGGFMAHDYDVDLGLVPGTDRDQVLAALHSIPDAEVEWIPGRFVIRLEGVVADLFTHEERDGLWWHSTLVHDWWNTPFGLQREAATGCDFWIPDDPERYLVENYGDWSRPVPFYEISFDTPNRVYRRGPDALRFLHSRVRIGLRTSDRWLVESAARELRDSFGVDITNQLATSGLLKPVEGREPPSV